MLFKTNDKLAHFLVCAAITSVIILLQGSPLWAFIGAMGFGFSKEAYDWWKKGKWDWEDIESDILGTITAIILMRP